jgi:hypothetical protein
MHTLWTIDNSYVSSRLAAPPKPEGGSATIRRSLNNKLRLISRESLGKLAPGWPAVSNLPQHGHYSVLVFDAVGAVAAPLP